MYCGQLEEALNYAEKGSQEDPDYPWIWLQLGKLRSHFGDKAGALEAVARGLALEPGDYEFLTLKKEIEAGCDVTRSVSKMTEIERRGGKRWDKPKKAGKSRDCRGGKF